MTIVYCCVAVVCHCGKLFSAIIMFITTMLYYCVFHIAGSTRIHNTQHTLTIHTHPHYNIHITPSLLHPQTPTNTHTHTQTHFLYYIYTMYTMTHTNTHITGCKQGGAGGVRGEYVASCTHCIGVYNRAGLEYCWRCTCSSCRH